MSMILGIVTLSDASIHRVVDDPPLAWRIVAPDDPEPYEAERSEYGTPSFLDRRRQHLGTAAKENLGIAISLT